MIERCEEFEYMDFDSKGNPEYSYGIEYDEGNNYIRMLLMVDTSTCDYLIIIGVTKNNSLKQLSFEHDTRSATESMALFALAWYERSIKIHLAKTETIVGWKP